MCCAKLACNVGLPLEMSLGFPGQSANTYDFLAAASAVGLHLLSAVSTINHKHYPKNVRPDCLRMQWKYIHHHLVGVVGGATSGETPGEVDMDTVSKDVPWPTSKPSGLGMRTFVEATADA